MGTSTWLATHASDSTRAAATCSRGDNSSLPPRIASEPPMTRIVWRSLLVAVAVATATAFAVTAEEQDKVRVRVQTELGDIVIEVDQAKAPITSANFLRYVDAGHYDGGTWHRTVKMDNQPESTVKIEVIQAGVNADKAKSGFPPIALERTSATGLLHKDGAISMARGMPDSATSGWFICI